MTCQVAAQSEAKSAAGRHRLEPYDARSRTAHGSGKHAQVADAAVHLKIGFG